jgi:hypothetical protein
MNSTPGTELDPYDLLVDGLLGVESEVGYGLFVDSVQAVQEAAEQDPSILVEHFEALVHHISIMLEDMGLPDTYGRVAYVRDIQRQMNRRSGVYVQVAEALENEAAKVEKENQ